MAKKAKNAADAPDATEEIEAVSGGKDNKAKKKGGKKAGKAGGGKQKGLGDDAGGAQRPPPPPPADEQGSLPPPVEEGYESPDITEGLDELEELAGLEGKEDPVTPTDALEDLAALEIPDDGDEAETVAATGGGMSKQERKAAEKLAKQEAEREKQRQKQEAKTAARLAKEEAKAEVVKSAEEEAAVEVAAANEAAIAVLREELGIKEGHPVEYQSATAKGWVPATLVEIRADGSLYVDLGNGRVNEKCDPQRVRPALFRAKPKVLEAYLKDAKRREKLESQAGAAVAAAEAKRLLAAKSLLLRSCHNGDLKGMRLALRDGASVNCRDSNLWTPLMCAARHGDTRCLRALINAAANVDSASRGGATALHMAASNGRADVIVMLLKAGADLSVATDSGMRPRQLAERRGMLEAVAAIDIFQKGGGLEQMRGSISSLAQREALRDVLTQAKVRRREVVAYDQSIKKQKGEQLLKSFRNQIGPLHRQQKAQQDFLGMRGEAHAEELEARWFSEHIVDPRGLQAGKRYLDLLTVHRLPTDKLDTAVDNIALLRKLFDALDTRQQGWLPRSVVYEFLQTMDPNWSPPGGRDKLDYSTDQEGSWATSFQTMLRIFVGSSTSVTAVETALLSDYSEGAGVVAGAAAVIRIGETEHGRSLLDYGEWVDTLTPALVSHTKKPHRLKAKEHLEVWRFLSKTADDDPRIKKYKHGGTDVSGVEHTKPSEPGHVDAATLIASVRPDGDGFRSSKNQKLYKKFYNGVLLPSVLAREESCNQVIAEQDNIVGGSWLRANRRVIVRADTQLYSAEVAILLPGETIQVLSTVRIVGSTMLRIQCVRGWVSHTSAMDNSIAFDRLDAEVGNGPASPAFDFEEVPTTDEEADAVQPSVLAQASVQDENDDKIGRSVISGDQVGLLAGMLCVALVPLRARKNAGPKSGNVAGGAVPKGQAFHIQSVSQKFPGYVLCYCGWVQILVRGAPPSVKFLDDTVEASQDFVIGGAGRISDVGPLGITFIEAPNPHWMPGSNEPKFCTTFHSVGRGSPAAKACKEMARGACYGWVLEYVEGVSVARMTFDDVLSLIQRTTKRPMKLRLRPPCFISVPLKPLSNEDGTDIAKGDGATEGQDEKGIGGFFFNSLMHGFYRTVHETTLRTGYPVGTRIAGVLAPGTFVEVIESRVNSMGHTRMLCVSLGRDDNDKGKGTQGWASLYARDGHRLLREQTEQEIRDRDHTEHNAFLMEERLNHRERTTAANDLHARKMAGQNSLEVRMFDAAVGGDEGWVLEQLQQGAHPDCLDSSGCTPIMRAAENGRDEIVKALWQYGVDQQKQISLNEVGEGGTALAMATANGHATVAALLLRYRADPLVADENGIKPIDVARKTRNDQLLPMLQEATNSAKMDMARARLKESVRMGAMHTFAPQIMRQVNEACDTLHMAISAGNVNRTMSAIGVLQSLDSANGVNRPDQKGTTPLAKAAAAGFCAIASLLLAHNATVDARNEGGQTALSMACSFGQVGATGLLLRAGADPALAVDSFSKYAESVRLAHPHASSVTGTQGAEESAGIAGCQLLLRKAFLAKNVVHTNQKAGRRPTGLSPINVDVWTGGRITDAGMQSKLNGVPSPIVSLSNIAAAPNGQASVNGDVLSNTAAQQRPSGSKPPKKRGLRRAAPVPDQPDATSYEPSVAAQVSEQTENPLASSYSIGLASPIAGGQATFDVEEGSPTHTTRGKKWTGGLKRRRKGGANIDDGQPGGSIVSKESLLPHDTTSTAAHSAARDEAEELAAIEIPRDDDGGIGEDTATEQIGDLL